MICPRCGTRKAKRHCPALNADICPQCCGTEREETIACPLSCSYLLDAREHERLVPITDAESPHPDVEVTEAFLRQHQTQLILLTNAVYVGSAAAPTAVDADLRAALAALVNEQRRQPNPELSDAALTIALHFGRHMTKLTHALTPEAKERFWSDEVLLKLIVFLHRLAVGRDNGRSRGRAFAAFLEDHFKRTMGGA